MTTTLLPGQPVDVHVEDAAEAEHLVDPAVVCEQVHPGQHAHHVADPERRDEQCEDQALAPSGQPGHVVRDRERDRQAQHAGDQRRRPRCAAAPGRRCRPRRRCGRARSRTGWRSSPAGSRSATGVRNTGSVAPNTIASTTYSGARKNSTATRSRAATAPTTARIGLRRRPVVTVNAAAISCRP